MKPIFVEGKSIAEVWENALKNMWEKGVRITTQYDYDPNTGIQHQPSLDSPLMMFVENALEEPRLHCCLEGGPAELAEYALEVVDGIKNHWVKTNPESKEWTYTYNGRLTNYGSNMNFATLVEDGPIDPNNPWTQVAYVRKVNGELKYENITPVNQIQHIIDTLAETPYSRRAVALTSFPPGDIKVSDPPCLRYIECRGYYRDGCLKIDMNVHFRSRDLWGAALFNMYALTELQKYITEEIQKKIVQKDNCPICNKKLDLDNENQLYCSICNVNPFVVKVGSYTDFSDSAHIYGIDLQEFENRFINGALNEDYKRVFWDLSTGIMKELIQEGKDKAYKTVNIQDEKNNKVNFPQINKDM